MKLIDPKKIISENVFEEIGNKWMLITSGEKEKFNTMTASWGAEGVLWNKNVSFIFVRPQRYTFEFLEKSDFYSLSFFDFKYREKLLYCGRNSGREVDKIKNSGLTPVFKEEVPYFKEAEKVMICKKIYSDFLNPGCFKDKSLDQNYENKDYHKMYVGEILKCLMRDENE